MLTWAKPKEDLQRHFPLRSTDTQEHLSKGFKIEAKQIKKAGNQQQFDHGVKVLEKFESESEHEIRFILTAHGASHIIKRYISNSFVDFFHGSLKK